MEVLFTTYKCNIPQFALVTPDTVVYAQQQLCCCMLHLITNVSTIKNIQDLIQRSPFNVASSFWQL